MRVMMETDFLKDERLGKRELKVLIVLIAHADKKTKECWPSRKRISELTGIHPPNVSQAIKNLITFKYITKLKSDGTTNRYKIKGGINLIPGEVSKQYPGGIKSIPKGYQNDTSGGIKTIPGTKYIELSNELSNELHTPDPPKNRDLIREFTNRDSNNRKTHDTEGWWEKYKRGCSRNIGSKANAQAQFIKLRKKFSLDEVNLATRHYLMILRRDGTNNKDAERFLRDHKYIKELQQPPHDVVKEGQFSAEEHGWKPASEHYGPETDLLKDYEDSLKMEGSPYAN